MLNLLRQQWPVFSSPRPSRFSNMVKSSNGLLTKAWLLQPHTTLHVKVITWRLAVDKRALPLNLLLVSSGDWAGCFISPGNDLVLSFHQLITIDIQHVIQDISTSHANHIKVCLQRSVQHVVWVFFQTDYNLQNSMVGSCRMEYHKTQGRISRKWKIQVVCTLNL